MDDYDYGRTPLRDPSPVVRASARERDDHRAPDPYRDRRRSPGSCQTPCLLLLLTSLDRRRERRRSRSPTQIDRYQPDRVRDDYAYGSRPREEPHQRRRSSPQPIDRYVPGPEPPALLVNPLPDPLKLDFQVGFTWFAEWWRTEQRIKEEKERAKTGRPPPRLRGERESREDRDAERPKIQAAYDQYKENLQRTQAQTFVRLHRNEDWFRERYVPEVRKPYREKLMAYRKGLFAQWEQDLSSGVFDDFTLEGIYKSESNGLGGILEREEGETSAAAEVLGVGDLLPSKGGDLRDPASMQPTLLIKTIAPTVTRERFETFAKEYLGEGDGGFQHLSLSDPNPLKKCHRMGWIMLNPESEQDQTEDEKAAPRDDADEAEDVKEMPSGLQTSSEKALEKINGKTIEDPERGNFTVHCGVHRPPDAPRKKALWDLFSAPERITRDLELATRLVRRLDNELGDEYFGVAKIEERVHDLSERGLLKSDEPQNSAKKDPDSMDADVEDGEEDEGMIDEDESDDEELLIRKKKLDLQVEYLRRVYSFCFFCVFESDSVHELQRKCPGGHLRRPRASLTSAAKETARASASNEAFPLRKKTEAKAEGDDEEIDMDVKEESPVEEKKSLMRPSTKTTQQLQRAYNWVKTFEEKILQILEPDNVNIRKLGGTPLDEGVEKELSKVCLWYPGHQKSEIFTNASHRSSYCKKMSTNSDARFLNARNYSRASNFGESMLRSGMLTSMSACAPKSSLSIRTCSIRRTSHPVGAMPTRMGISPSTIMRQRALLVASNSTSSFPWVFPWAPVWHQDLQELAWPLCLRLGRPWVCLACGVQEPVLEALVQCAATTATTCIMADIEWLAHMHGTAEVVGCR